MSGTRQPARDDFFRRLGAKRDVLARETWLIASAEHAVLGLAAIGTAMFKVIFSSHVASVAGGGLAQRARNAEWRCGGEQGGAAPSVLAPRSVDQLDDARANGGIRFSSHHGTGHRSVRSQGGSRQHGRAKQAPQPGEK